MGEHRNFVPGYYGSHQDLARDIANMDYGSVSLLVSALADELHKQSEHDFSKGRVRLSTAMNETVESLRYGVINLGIAWKISKPHSTIITREMEQF